MSSLKKLSIAALLALFLTACGGGGDDTDTGGGTDSTTAKICTGAEIAGQWQVTLKAQGVTQSQVFTLDGSESVGTNTLTLSENGITLTGTVDPSCTSASGTVTANGITGTWTAVKI